MDYEEKLKELYKELFVPEVGSIWKAPNRIWTTNFAKNNNSDQFHPSIIEKVYHDGISIQLAPGSSKNYRKGKCVFKVILKNQKITSYFLLKLSMPYLIEDLIILKRGWNSIEKINGNELKRFNWQIKICK
jgi:hypothetical protein